jgi:protein-disulfide isomerase
VLEKNQGNVKLVYKNLPLKMHDMAEPAARAALAANKQGKFWEYHDKLFAEEKITSSSLDRIAQEISLDKKRFKKDMDSQELRQQVKNEIAEATKLGVTGTPTIFVNGRRLKQRSLQGFQILINQELRKSK